MENIVDMMSKIATMFIFGLGLFAFLGIIIMCIIAVCCKSDKNKKK